MNNNYNHTIVFKLNEPFDLNYIEDIVVKNPRDTILVEVQNTKGITSDMIRNLNPNIDIRIAGAHDNERLKIYENTIFCNKDNSLREDCKEYYYDSVIYSRNETIKILEEIEKIESGIDKNWSDFQKLIYIYDSLKREIMYDPKFEKKPSKDTRSLRGLVTKETVCAGYSLILKEMLDRQNIKCDYIHGKAKNGSGHVWNIVTIDDKMYPIDLTWENTRFRYGQSETFSFLAVDTYKFNENHIPDSREPLYGYQDKLSSINPKLIKEAYSQIGLSRNKSYESTTYSGKRKDGTKFIVSQIKNAIYKKENYYRYYFQEIFEDGRKGLPLILYSNTNLAYLIDSKKFERDIPKDYEDTVTDILFSRDNIADSISKKTFYIGSVNKNTKGNKLDLVSSPQEISKPEEKRNLFQYPSRRCKRSDGTVFIIQQMYEEPHIVNAREVLQYDIFEMIHKKGKDTLVKNTIYAEQDLFKDNRQEIIDDFLSRKNLNLTSNKYGGYIGYYDENNTKRRDQDLIRYFETSSKVEISSNDNSTSIIPTFDELKELCTRYTFDMEFNSKNLKSKITDTTTGQIVTDERLKDKVIFANIWLSSAGVKIYYDDIRPGYRYAFNNKAEELYETICNEFTKSARDNDSIDTVGLLKKVMDEGSYKYDEDIVVRLFRTEYQTELINKMFLNHVGKDDLFSTPEPLHSIGHAGELISSSTK